MQSEIDNFVKSCEKCGIYLNKSQIRQFLEYYDILIEYNKSVNLTAITDFNEVLLKHFLDSLTINKIIDLSKISTIIDIGTGAGFPGIPIKIAFPEIKVVLLDSLNKRVKFLNDAIENLMLKDIDTIHARAEDYSRKEDYREKFDLCVSRAVSKLSTLSEYCIPYVKKDGYFISYKSGKAEDEIKNAKNAISLLGGKLEKAECFIIPDTDISRILVKIKKQKITPKKYPRKAGIPDKEPL